MNHGDAILRAILDDPADDLPRLAYADWLLEQGDDAGAEFIRAQVEVGACGLYDCPTPILAARPRGRTRCGSCRFCRPKKRAEEACGLLLHEAAGDLGMPYAYTTEWHANGRDPATTHATLYLWRGFVQAVRCPLHSWLEHGPAVVRAHPVERVVTDATPLAFPDDPRPVWRSYQFANYDVFRFMAGERVNLLGAPSPHGTSRRYDSEQAALDALSAALLAWAKLPPESR